jgi:indolepyruvate ferredoxin oxidoreductase alpha subunit
LRLAHLQSELSEVIAKSEFTLRKDSTAAAGERIGILCTGMGFALAGEHAPEDAGIFKTAGDPFPDDEIKSFIDCHDRIVILEEGDPILEARARALASNCVSVQGRLSGDLKRVGELQPHQVAAVLTETEPLELPEDPELPIRFPEICKPCGYHKVFGAIRELKEIATPSDIGCNSLGGIPPYSVMDGVWAMGSSIGVGCGLAAVGHRRVLAIIGDSTFFHAGIPPVIEAVYQGYRMSVLLLDNGTAAMTGGQGVAHRPINDSLQSKIDLVRVIESLGVTRCVTFDPHKLGQSGIRDLIEESFTQPGVKVLLYRSQCGIYNPGYFTDVNSLNAKGGTG